MALFCRRDDPLIYVTFALIAAEYPAAAMELLFGVPFIAGGVVCLIFRMQISPINIGILWVVHAAFDVLHGRLFVNLGVPEWYPLFCAAVDVMIGAYMCLK